MKKNLPIGIFDSGVGGLTVAKALADKLPSESIIYFGDTAYFPYGDKKVEAIQERAKKIADLFLDQGVKLMVIACNTASIAAYEMLQDYVGDRALVIDVVNPMVRFLCKNYVDKRVGLVGTKFTVSSDVYNKKLSEFNCSIKLSSLAAPLLVSMIEEGVDHKLIDDILAEYLTNDILQDIEVLALGCTHYSVIKERIASFYDNKINVVSVSEIIASEVEKVLVDNDLLLTNNSKYLDSVISQLDRGIRCFYVSQYSDNFLAKTRLLFDRDVAVEVISD